MAKYFIIKTKSRDSKVLLTNLNYVNIERRYLCYHLTNSEVKTGMSLTTTFHQAITPLEKYENLIYVHPSLLINLSNISEIHTDKIIFADNEVLYVPRVKRQMVYDKWIALTE